MSDKKEFVRKAFETFFEKAEDEDIELTLSNDMEETGSENGYKCFTPTDKHLCLKMTLRKGEVT